MSLKKLLNEIDFGSQAAFDAYKEKHKMRDTTKVKIAGKETTAGAASKKSEPKKAEPKKAEAPKKETPKETSSIKHTPTKEDSAEVKKISQFTTVRPKALSDFINKHKLDAGAISKFVEKGNLKDRMDLVTALVGNPGNKYEKDIIKKFGEKGEEKKEEPKSEPAKKRPGNPQVNKAAKSGAEKAGITPQKLGKDEYIKTMYKAAVEALTDSNFHDEARELVASIEGKPEWAKKPDYPSPSDPKFSEKMKAIKSGVDSSEYWDYDDNTRDYAVSVSQESGWDGVQAADGIAFTLRMNGFHKEADRIQSIFDNKPYMKAK